MDTSALASAESWLSAIAMAKLIAAALVAAGVAIEFGAEWAARPFERIVKEARETETDAARKEIARANAALPSQTNAQSNYEPITSHYRN